MSTNILPFLQKIWKEGEVREIRSSDRQEKKYYGYFSTPELAAQQIYQIDGKHNVYITLNPCAPALLARCSHRMQIAKEGDTTKDKEIISLDYLLIDLDPIRPSKISSTDAEKVKAFEVASKIMTDLGNPMIFGDSGNGYHLIYKHNAKDSQALKAYLESLAQIYDNSDVEVDRKVYNPSRITKVLGVLAMKGDNIPERPWRRSGIINMFDDCVTLDIPDVKQCEPPTPQNHNTSTRISSHDSLDYARNFLSEHGIGVQEEKTWQDCTMLVLTQCVFDPSHNRKEAAVLVHPSGTISYKCQHNSCHGKTWQDLRNMVGEPSKLSSNSKPCNICGKPIWFKPAGNGKWIVMDYPSGEIHVHSTKTPIDTIAKSTEIDKIYNEFLKDYNFSRDMMDDTITIDGRPYDDFEEKKLREKAYAVIPRLSIDRLECKIFSLADKTRYNPIEDYVKSLPIWDGQDHIGTLATCFKTQNECSLFPTRRKFEYFLAKAARRWMTGKHPVCLVLSSEGQGIGKSTFFKWLCPVENGFVAKPINPDSKDDKIAQANTMLWEIEELGATTRRKDMESLKSFLSCEFIKERKAYARHEIKKIARCVFCATVNDTGGFLADVENRRFLVVEVESIDLKYTQIDRNQIFAQAYEAMKNGKDDLDETEKIIQRELNKNNRMESAIEIKILEGFEATGNDEDFLESSKILNYLLDAGFKIRGNEMSVAMAAIGCKSWRGYDNSTGKTIRGYKRVKAKLFR